LVAELRATHPRGTGTPRSDPEAAVKAGSNADSFRLPAAAQSGMIAGN